ncbi:flavodoxin family protein [Methanoregula sp.]|uniref:flavodoxin family protein n=1 Tax=Methanoregula sp. TaxID=2052170 RepID=UPI003C7623BB
MEPVRELMRSVTAGAETERYRLTLHREDFSALYPGMVRYVLAVMSGDVPLAIFRTNTYEYSPLDSLTAETAAVRAADEWENELRNDPSGLFRNYPPDGSEHRAASAVDLVVIQGSPRADGNCGILASWAVEAAHDASRTAQVIYPHDLDIHGCIGCYQCYNTGSCVFDDDMMGIINAIRGASLIIACSPVYTNTVTGVLKLVIDRTQAYHAERALHGGRTGQKGLIFSVAGRKGEDNFICITRVVSAFFRNLDIEPVGQVLIDHVDTVRDIRTITGLEQEVKEKVHNNLR